MGYQYFSEELETCDGYVTSVTSPPAKTPSGDMGCPKNIDSVVKKTNKKTKGFAKTERKIVKTKRYY